MAYSGIWQAVDFHIQEVSSAVSMEVYPDSAKEQQAALNAWSPGPSSWMQVWSGQEQNQRIRGKQRLKQRDWRTRGIPE